MELSIVYFRPVRDRRHRRGFADPDRGFWFESQGSERTPGLLVAVLRSSERLHDENFAGGQLFVHRNIGYHQVNAVGTAKEEYRSTAWIEGFAVLMAVLICATVTAANDYQK